MANCDSVCIRKLLIRPAIGTVRQGEPVLGKVMYFFTRKIYSYD